MKLHRYVDHQRLHIVTKDVISLSISVLLLFRHYISHKITSSGGVFCSACGAFITDELSIEANSLDPEQTAPYRSSLIWVTVCHKGSLNISADKKSR